MLRALLVAALASVTATAVLAGPYDQPPPEAYLDPIDRQVAASGEAVGNRIGPCEILKKRETKGGVVHDEVEWLPTEKCVRMTEPQKFSGLWRNDFEGSQFCAAPAKECSSGMYRQSAWLRWNGKGADRKLYRVEFIGRQTRFAGAYGHFGLWPHEVIVDRMISMKVVWAPPPPTKADIQSMIRQCHAMPSCAKDEKMMKALEDQLKE